MCALCRITRNNKAKEQRYESWETYFKTITRSRKDRKNLSVSDLMKLLEKQNFKCALSGLSLTRKKDSIYNASIDRIEAGGEYTIDNVQLVCKCVNTWRGASLKDEFVKICKAVAEYNT